MNFLLSEKRLVYKVSVKVTVKPGTQPGAVKGKPSEKPKTAKEKTAALKKAAKEKRAKVLAIGKGIRAKMKLKINKLSPKKEKEAQQYIMKVTEAQRQSMLQQSTQMSIFDLTRGGSLRLTVQLEKDQKKKLDAKKKLKDNQGYGQMTAMFSRVKQSAAGMYLDVDLRGVGNKKERADRRREIGAGHLCHPSWKKVSIEDKEGNVRVGYRKIPGEGGVLGEKIGYYEKVGDEWVYIPVFTGYKIRPLEIDSNWQVQAKKEEEFYRKRKIQIEKNKKKYGYDYYTPGVVPKFTNKEKQRLIDQGSFPFATKIGYQLSVDDRAWYRAQRREGNAVSKLSVNKRWEIFQKKWKLKDAINLVARKAAHIKPRHLKRLMSVTDALMKCESSYSLGSVNMRNWTVVRESSAGILQIKSSTYNSTRRKWFAKTRLANRYRRSLPRANIDYSQLAHLDWSAPRPEFSTSFNNVVFALFYIIRYSRTKSGYVSIDEMLDKMEKAPSKRMRDTWALAPRIMWRNGPTGALPIVKNMVRGISFPRTKAEATDYFHNQLPKNCWQYRRGFKDFWMLVRNCNNYLRRYNQNCSQLDISS